MNPHRFVLGVAAIVVLSSSSVAQTPAEPARPPLPPAADTNSALAYVDRGTDLLLKSPAQSYAAFYWASRINPGLADAFYGRRIALLVGDRTRLERYMEGNRRTIQSKEFRQIDSLQYRALMLNPFFYRRFDRVMFDEYLKEEYRRDAALAGEQPNMSEFAHWTDVFLMRAGPASQAWAAYNRANFPAAAKFYASAIKRARKDDKYLLHADRGRTLFLMGLVDSAEVDLKQALDYLRKQDEDKITYFYESKAVYEHSIALTHEMRKQYDAAREAYGRALQEDISYYPAHVGMARAARALGDTAAAISALDLAVQVNPNDGTVRLFYAEALTSAGRHDEAATQLRAAIDLEPHFADLYVVLGDVMTKLNKPAEAQTAYTQFLARSSRTDQRRATAEKKLRELTQTSAK